VCAAYAAAVQQREERVSNRPWRNRRGPGGRAPIGTWRADFKPASDPTDSPVENFLVASDVLVIAPSLRIRAYMANNPPRWADAQNISRAVSAEGGRVRNPPLRAS